MLYLFVTISKGRKIVNIQLESIINAIIEIKQLTEMN